MLSDQARDPEPQQDLCPSVSLRGVQCKGQRGHGALHSAEIDAVLFAWSDESSPTLAIDLYWPGGCELHRPRQKERFTCRTP
jgi:hypothetical protein